MTAAPGRVFERRVDQRAPRHYRSSFAEYVELVIIGAVMTLFAVCIVLLVAGLVQLVTSAEPLNLVSSTEPLNLGELLSHPGEYVKAEPWRIVIASVVAIGLSFGLAYVIPPLIVEKPKDGDDWGYYQHSAWLKKFLEQRPTGKAVAIAAQFSDGYKAVGILTGFTPTQVEDREMVLEKLRVTAPAKAPVDLPGDNFLIVRESQIGWMIGQSVARNDAEPTASVSSD